MKVRFDEPDVVVSQVIDSTGADSACDHYEGVLPGVVRALLSWETAYHGEVADKMLLGAVANKENV